MRRGNGHYNQGRTRYQPLVDYLAASIETKTMLTFSEIEAIIGMPLSTTACVSGDIWTAPRFIYVQRWRALGWGARLDRRNRCVVFTRLRDLTE